MASKGLKLINKLRNNYSKNLTKVHYANIFERSNVSYKEQYFIFKKVNSDIELQNKFITTLDKKVLQSISRNEIVNQLDNFLNKFVKKNKDVTVPELKEWKKNLKNLSENKVSFYYPIKNLKLVSEQMDLSNDITFYQTNKFIEDNKILKSTEWDSEYNEENDVYKYFSQGLAILKIVVKGYPPQYLKTRAYEIAKKTISLLNFSKKGIDSNVSIINNIYVNQEKGVYKSFDVWSMEDIGLRYDLGIGNNSYVYELTDSINEFAFVFNPQNNIERQLARAINFLGEASTESDIKTKFSKSMYALESIAEIKQDSIGVAEQVSTFVSIYTSDDISERKELKKKIKEEYDNRSRLVHGEDVQLRFEDYEFIYKYVEKMINKIIKVRSSYSDVKDIWDELINKVMEINI